MTADLLTKPLKKDIFNGHRNSLKVLCMGTVRGGVDIGTGTMQNIDVLSQLFGMLLT